MAVDTALLSYSLESQPSLEVPVYLVDVSGGYEMATLLSVKPEMRLEPWDAYLTSALAIVNCEPPRIMQLCGSTLHRHIG